MSLQRWIGLMALIIVACVGPYFAGFVLAWRLYRRVHGVSGHSRRRR